MVLFYLLLFKDMEFLLDLKIQVSCVTDPGAYFKLTTVITLVAGTIFLMWLGEQITQRGIGNGISLIIFSGIVAEIPRALATTFELGRTGALSATTIFVYIYSFNFNSCFYSFY